MSVVYFLRPVGFQGPVKIGCSYAPARRLHHYSQWSPYPLEIAATIEGDQRLEGRFHRFFAHLHSHHEWFIPSPEIDAVIGAINSGAFATEALPPQGSLMRSRIASETWARRRAGAAA